MAAEPARANWADHLLRLCPILIAMVWIAGVASFRDFAMQPLHWAIAAAAGFATLVVLRRLMLRQPTPKLPEGASVVKVSAWIALVFALITFVVGGIVEVAAQQRFPSDTPWGLRTLWHGACAYGGAYCVFLQRLLRAGRA